jgi:hypothetical protein
MRLSPAIAMFLRSNCSVRPRLETRLFIVALALLTTNAPIRASDVDSEHLFGFTEGADIGKTGEREAETETIGRFGKSAGSYAAVIQNDSLKMVPFDNFRVSANAALAYFQISGVPGLEDRQLGTLLGFALEARYMLMDRTTVHSG